MRKGRTTWYTTSKNRCRHSAGYKESHEKEYIIKIISEAKLNEKTCLMYLINYTEKLKIM